MISSCWLRWLCFVVLAALSSCVFAQKAPPPARAKGRAITDRYPLKYPPTLADGSTSAVEETAEFLVPGPNLREGVEIAKTPPRVEFSFYPLQNYPGNPWSHRSDGFVRGDKYYSSSNDHLAPRGTAHLWEYDAITRKFRLLCDTTKFLEAAGAFPQSMNYRPGEMQSRIDRGSDGWLYYATDRGSPTVTNDAHGYLGEWILRTHPETLVTEIVVTHPIAKHTIPASVLDPQQMILYCGTAPGKDSPNQNVQFFALDLKSRKILKVADGGPTRTLIFSPSTGRVFWEGKVYDPRTNEISPAAVPHVRSCSPETPQGLVYGTSGTKADLWSLNVKTGEVRELGSAAVAGQEYISSIEVDPTGRYLYYVPGAHGGATKDGTPIVQFDTRTGNKKVLAFLHERFWQQHGYALDGSFGNALDEKGERFFISWDGWRKGQPRGWESASLTVLHIPASERSVDAAPRQAMRLDARTIMKTSVTQHVELSSDGEHIQLQQGVLIEDDGPAAGYSYQPNEELLSMDVWIKKDLWIDRPAARQATLLVGRQPGKDPQPLEATINGQAARLEAAGSAGRYFEAYRIDPKLLVAGKNEIVLRGTGKIWIARDDEYASGSRERTRHPNRSAKSTDGGRTWDYEHLGTRGDVDGEYYVRLFLDQSLPQGTITLPVVDAGNLSGRPIPPVVSTIDRVRIQTAGDGFHMRTRSGTTYVPHDTTWSDWQDVGGQHSNEPLRGRYVQVSFSLASDDPLATPRLNNLTIEAQPTTASDWTSGLRVIERRNPPIVRSSIPFEYEPWEHSDLRTLRERYKLDEVVKGAKSEFETICRLAAWSSQLWEKGHLAESYPAFSALEILSSHTDGKPLGGFCQQYNLVFLQACESFGIPGRAVSIGQGGIPGVRGSGHEVVEVWSNDHRQWVYVDGNCAWYLVDQATGLPLSLLELRERQLDALAGKPGRAVSVVELAETRFDWEGITSWPPFTELRLIPRSNFLQERSPLPLNQGMRGWFWTGHQVWTDERLPAALLYGNRVPQRNNWQWTLNQAHYVLEPLAERGQVRVHLDTVTPGFETFMARIDDQPAQPVEDGFVWTLHAGRNLLEVYPRNRAGRAGTSSRLVLDWE